MLKKLSALTMAAGALLAVGASGAHADTGNNSDQTGNQVNACESSSAIEGNLATANSTNPTLGAPTTTHCSNNIIYVVNDAPVD